MLNKDLEKRPTIKQVMEHPWFEDSGFTFKTNIIILPKPMIDSDDGRSNQ